MSVKKGIGVKLPVLSRKAFQWFVYSLLLWACGCDFYINSVESGGIQSSESGDTLSAAIDPGADLESAESECEEIWQTEVKPYLDQKCTLCHGESLVGGAPMSLATYAESIAPSPYGAGPLYDRIFVRADEQTMPLSGVNTSEELAVLENWAAVCADEFAELAEEKGGESTEEGGESSEEEGGEIIEPCDGGYILDCDDECAPQNYLGDGSFCDDGVGHANFNCAEFNYDEGDCVNREEGEEGGTLGTRLDGTCEEMWAAEVNPYLKQKCKSCHGETPVAGAPMSLTNYEESIAPSPYGNAPLYDRIFIRADAQTMPLSGGNTEEELQMLETWSILCSAEFSEPPEEGGESSEEGGAEEGGGPITEPEDTEETCTDGKDNDGDNFVDCYDFDCSATAACGEEGEEGGSVGGTCEEMWLAEVQPYLEDNCVSCHGYPPSNYAPMALNSYQASISPSLYGSGPLYERIFIRAASQTMPPLGGNTPDQLLMLETWSLLCASEFAE